MSADITNLFPNKEQFDTMNALLAVLASKNGEVRLDSWYAVQQAVRMGGGPSLFPVGTQLVCEKEKTVTATTTGSTGISAASVTADTFVQKMGSAHGAIYEFTYDGHAWHYNGEPVTLSEYGISVTGNAAAGDVIEIAETTDKIVWDVVAHDYNVDPIGQYKHSMTLLTHDCFVNSLQYDNTEALYFCAAQLAAGTYHFTLLEGYDTTYGGGKTYQFTLTKSVPANGVILFPWAYNTQASATKVSTYNSVTETTAIETVSVTEGRGGTDLGTADGKTANMNHTHRIRYGSNNWKESAMRQFLNSAAPAGQVWKSQTKFDRPPSWEKTQAGWMNGLDPEFLAVVGTAKITNRTNSLYEEEGNTQQNYYTEDKFWLASRSEVYGGSESGLSDGTQFPYYVGTTNAEKIKYNTSGAARSWWLRSPYPSHAVVVRSVFTDGSLGYVNANSSTGVAAACVIF